MQVWNHISARLSHFARPESGLDWLIKWPQIRSTSANWLPMPQCSTQNASAGVEPHFGAALRRRDAHHARRAPLRRGTPGIINPAPTTNSPTTPPCTHWKSHTDKRCILHPIPCTPCSALYWKHYTTPFTGNPVLRNPTYTLHSLLNTLTRVRTGSGTGPPRGKRAPRVGIISTVFGVMAYIYP